MVLALIIGLVSFTALGWRRYVRAQRLLWERQEFTRRLMRDREAERRRIAGELHSNLGQNLLIMKHRAEMGLGANGDQQLAREQLQAISQLCSQTIGEARLLAQGLGPRHLAEIGLTGALDAMIDRVAAVTDITFRRRLEPVSDALDQEAAVNVYRIAQEALNNVLKHSQARKASVELIRDLTEIRLTVEDDGRGMPASSPESVPLTGLGLPEMHERARMLGGELTIAPRSEGGSRVLLTVPTADLPAVMQNGH